MRTLLKGKRLLVCGEEIEDGSLFIENGKISRILRESPHEGDFEVLDYRDSIVSPGFIDVHVHGANGFDTMDGTYEAIEGMSRYLASTGTTGFLATSLTTSHTDILCAIRAVKEAKEQGVSGANLLGMHLEGPFINVKKKGAQNAKHVRNPDPTELQTFIELLGDDFKLITLAPELDEGFKTTQLARGAGAMVSAGHSCCPYDVAIAAFDAGVTHATHLFNGMEPFLHRDPGLVGAVLADSRVSAEIIADGIHLHPGTINVIMAAKGVEKTVLITDCIRAGNYPDGDYELGGLKVSVHNGICRTEEGSLAGSTLRMITAVKNMVELCSVSLAQAVQLASRNPAVEIGLVNTKGSLESGKDADITVFDESFQVQLTMVEGRVVYKNEV